MMLFLYNSKPKKADRLAYIKKCVGSGFSITSIERYKADARRAKLRNSSAPYPYFFDFSLLISFPESICNASNIGAVYCARVLSLDKFITRLNCHIFSALVPKYQKLKASSAKNIALCVPSQKYSKNLV